MSGEQVRRGDNTTPLEPQGMSRGVQTAWIVGTIWAMGLALMVVVGAQLDAVIAAQKEAIARVQSATLQASADGSATAEATADEPVTVDNKEVGRPKSEREDALSDARYSSGSAAYDSEAVAGTRRMTEIVELSCRKYGTNCDEAKLMRRRLEEMQLGL